MKYLPGHPRPGLRRPSSRRRKILRKALLALLLVIPPAIAGCGGGKVQETTEAEKPPTPVEAIRVTNGLLSREIQASGVTAGIHEAYVVSETQGTITSVELTLGQHVELGDLLVHVDDRVQKIALEQARNAASAAELNLNVTEKLFEDGNASKAELTASRTGASGALAQLESSWNAYDDCRITSPISGYIAQKAEIIEPGNFLPPGTLVTRVVDLDSLETTVSVGEMEVGILEKGMPARIRVPAAGDREFPGIVRAVAAGSDPATGSYPVEVIWKNSPNRLVKSGMSARVTIRTTSPDSALMIPAGAIVEKDRKEAVFVALDGKAKLRFVETGRIAGNRVEIPNGLNPGDILLVTGITALSRGERIATTIRDHDGGDR